ncbi:MAG: hypothetical protein J6K75_00895 [Erysipelotrichaceae bacterium]|nr:hypothetical protein [Erysipelotrichaceae bacterium]
MRKLISILILSAVFFSFAGCTPADQEKFNSYIPDAATAELEGYTNIENSKGFMEITSNDVLSSVGNKDITAYVFMGSINCHYCQDAIVEIQRQALEHGEVVYYLSMDKIESEEKYNQLVEVLTPILETNNEGKHVLYMPHLFKIVDGELVDGHLGFGEGYDYSDVFTSESAQKDK